MSDMQLAAEVAVLKERVDSLTETVEGIRAEMRGHEATQTARHAENQRQLQQINTSILRREVERDLIGRVLGWAAKVGIALGSGAAGWHFRDWLPPHH